MGSERDELCAALRALAEEIRTDRLERQALNDTVDELKQAVSRYCVVAERQLARQADAQIRAAKKAGMTNDRALAYVDAKLKNLHARGRK